MRTLHFEAHKIEDTKRALKSIFIRAPISPQIYICLVQALMEFRPGDDVQVARRLEELLEMFEEIRVVKDAGGPKEDMYLLPDGAELAMSDDKFDVLEAAWRGYRQNLSGQFVHVRNRVEKLLEDAPQYNEKEWEERIADRVKAEIAAQGDAKTLPSGPANGQRDAPEIDTPAGEASLAPSKGASPA